MTSYLQSDKSCTHITNSNGSHSSNCTYPSTITIVSPTGKTKTLPHFEDNSYNKTVLAIVSCSNLAAGFFNAYSSIAANHAVDAVIHLGDYIYEYRNAEYGDGRDIGRLPLPDRKLRSLKDFRERHAQYKEDVDLQALHRMKPMIMIWGKGLLC